MKKIARSLSHLFIVFIAVGFLFNACNDSTQVAGGQDFPNSLEQLAMLGFKGVNETQNLSHASVREVNHTSSDTTATNPPATGFRPITAKTSALVRLASPQNGAADFDSSIWNYQDTAKGHAIYIRKWSLWGFSATDTFQVVWNDKARDTIKTNNNITQQNGTFQLGTGGITWYYDMRDTSGDYRFDWRRLLVVHPIENGIIHTEIKEEGSGPDGDILATTDNALFLSADLLANLNDTLRYQSQVDLDQDGVIWFGGKDSNWIEFDGIKKGDSAEVGFTRSEYSLAGIFNTKQFDLSHPIHFKGRYDLKDGSIIRIEIFGNRKDATAFPGDTASFKLEVIYPDTAMTNTFTLNGKILLPSKGIDYNTARFLGADGAFTLSRGNYQTVEFHLSDLDIKLADLKLPWTKGRLRVTGVLPQKGSETIELEVANGTWVGQGVSVDGKIWNVTKDSSGMKVSAK